MSQQLRCSACDTTVAVSDEDPGTSWQDMVQHVQLHNRIEQHAIGQPTIIVEPVPTAPACICCTNRGALPSIPGLPQAVPGDVVVQMCDECVDAAFLSGGTRPHPHPIGF